MICGYLQAPDCIYAWLEKYTNSDLRTVINKINTADNSLFCRMNIKEISGENIAKNIYKYQEENKELNSEHIELYSKFWSILATDYLENVHHIEYNSIKHGFRISSGGFKFKMKPHNVEEPAPADQPMQEVGSSEFGASFVKLENIASSKNDRNFRLKQHYVNWDYDQIRNRLILLSCSIRNVISALKICNGIDSQRVSLVSPTETEAFTIALRNRSKVTHFTLGVEIEQKHVSPTTKQDLEKFVEEYNRKRIEGCL